MLAQGQTHFPYSMLNSTANTHRKEAAPPTESQFFFSLFLLLSINKVHWLCDTLTFWLAIHYFFTHNMRYTVLRFSDTHSLFITNRQQKWIELKINFIYRDFPQNVTVEPIDQSTNRPIIYSFCIRYLFFPLAYLTSVFLCMYQF